MDWSRREMAMYAASRQRLSDDLMHVGKAHGFKRHAGHRIHRNNYRDVPGDVGSLPPRERIERDPDFQRITTEQVGTPKRSRPTNRQASGGSDGTRAELCLSQGSVIESSAIKESSFR